MSRSQIEKYACKNFQFIGSGACRSAFVVELPGWELTVLKVNHSFGDNDQTLTEIKRYQTWDTDLFPDVYDWDKEGNWIEMEYLQPITYLQFTELVGVKWDTFYNNPFYSLYYHKEKSYIKKIKKLHKKGLRLWELARLIHWGLDHKGNLKILDFGC